MSQTDIEKALRRGSNFENSKLRIWEIYQTQPDRKLRAKALAKEYAPHGPGGCSHTYLDGSSGWLDHDSKGLTFEHYPDHQKIFLRWNQVEKYIDLMMQADRYLTDKEKSAIELYFGLNADSAAEYNALKEQYPDALVGFEQNGQFEFYGEDARKICELTGGKLLERETALGTVTVTGFPREQWVYEAEGAGNARTQKVDIYFNYVGQVDIAYTEEELAELKAQKEQEERQRMEKQRKREKAYREKRKAKKIAENGGEIIKTKTCPHCGKVFTPTSNRQLFCSRECWNQARQEQKEAAREAERGTHYYRQRTCAVCGHSYWPTHSQQEFCSDECRRINHNRKTLEFYHKKKGNPKPDPEAVPTPKPKEDNAA